MIRLLMSLCALVALLCNSGCAALVKEPHITVQATDVVSVDTGGFDIELLVEVTNPNSFDITLHGYTFDLQVLAVPFASGGLHKAVRFPAGETISTRLPFRVHHNELLGIIKRKPDLDRIPYELNARLAIDTPLGEHTVPISKKDTFSVPASYRPDTYLKRLLKPLRDMF
jgi:LEA14-like dessication related protein